MNEDEAFIRAIVDAPGDDTPRLVYADWLDDYDDPRGPYLRAEFEWAKPWRDGKRPADNPVLRELAAPLNAVWVARVSWPPMGVCCEHITFECGGGRLTDAELDVAGRELEVTFPVEYRSFLLNHNGGKPVSHAASVGDTGTEIGHPVEWFDPLEDVAAPDDHPLRHWLGDVPEHPALRGCIPIGTTNADDDAVYLGYAGNKVGQVYVWHEFKTGDDDPNAVERLATSLPALLTRLKLRRR